MNKKQINSNNRLKLVKKIERIHQKIHKMFHQAKGKFAKDLADVSLSECVRQLEYKANWYNKKIYKINTYYPSTQMCSNCKNKNPKLKDLSIREWECSNCKYFHDRDINASINILDEGLKLYMKELVKK